MLGGGGGRREKACVQSKKHAVVVYLSALTRVLAVEEGLCRSVSSSSTAVGLAALIVLSEDDDRAL